MKFNTSSLTFFLYLVSVACPTAIAAPEPPRVDTLVERSTNTTAIEPPRILLKIDEKVAIIAAGFTGTLAVTAIAAYITTLVKNQSDSHSCDVISGDVDKTRYEYSASGRHCDTTSESKTIKAAVQKALEYMEDHNVSQACFELKHGGTWKGLLQLAVANRNIIHNKCRTVTYKIDV